MQKRTLTTPVEPMVKRPKVNNTMKPGERDVYENLRVAFAKEIVRVDADNKAQRQDNGDAVLIMDGPANELYHILLREGLPCDTPVFSYQQDHQIYSQQLCDKRLTLKGLPLYFCVHDARQCDMGDRIGCFFDIDQDITSVFGAVGDRLGFSAARNARMPNILFQDECSSAWAVLGINCSLPGKFDTAAIDEARASLYHLGAAFEVESVGFANRNDAGVVAIESIDVGTLGAPVRVDVVVYESHSSAKQHMAVLMRLHLRNKQVH